MWGFFGLLFFFFLQNTKIPHGKHTTKLQAIPLQGIILIKTIQCLNLKDLRKCSIYLYYPLDIRILSRSMNCHLHAAFGETKQNRASQNIHKNGPRFRQTDLVSSQKPVQIQLKRLLFTNYEK